MVGVLVVNSNVSSYIFTRCGSLMILLLHLSSVRLREKTCEGVCFLNMSGPCSKQYPSDEIN